MMLVICSKSTWHPTIRREHAIAQSAAADGYRVVFLERPLDVRALRSARDRRAWLRGVRGLHAQVAPGIRVVHQSTLVPGHRSPAAQWIDAIRLRGVLSRIADRGTIVVATQPWHWPAVAAAPAARRVFDGADDWRSLLPHRAAAIDALYRRIAREADAVILVSDAIAPAFGDRAVAVVPNGAREDLLEAPLRPRPADRRMVYAGTLSERFDERFLRAVLDRTPGWSVELFGQCQYRGSRSGPSPELAKLLEGEARRVDWRGPVERAELAGALDRGRVLIAPHRGALTRGQDSMKLYDYAARGRPIICTPGALGTPEHVAGAGVVEAATPDEFAAAVERVGGEDGSLAAARRDWVAQHTWASRWPGWLRAARGAVSTEGEVRASHPG